MEGAVLFVMECRGTALMRYQAKGKLLKYEQMYFFKHKFNEFC